MKILLKLALSLMAFTTVQSYAQTADDIIAKYIAAEGGADKVAALKTVKMSGTMSVQGTDISITLTRAQMIGTRMDLEIMGTSNYQVANTTKGAVFMPVMGMTEPKEMTADELQSAQSSMDLQGALFNYKQKGNTVTLKGKEKVEGNDAYHLEVTTAGGKKTQYYIDAATSRLVKTAAQQQVNGESMDVETTFSDFKQNADGYWFPYAITNPQGTITFDTIETNKPVDESIFKN